MLWYDYVNMVLLLIIWLIIFSDPGSIYSARKYWVFFLAVYTLTEFISLPLSLKGIHNLWLYNISKPMQFVLLLAYFVEVFRVKKNYRVIMIGMSVLICSFFLTRFNLAEYNSWGDSVYGSFIIILCVIYFYNLITSDNFIKLELSEFWYCGGLFVFFGTNLCVNTSLNFLIEKHPEIAKKLFYLLVINSIIFYLSVAYALLSGKKKVV